MIEVSKTGAVSYNGPEAVNLFRMKMILSGLKAEMQGFRLTRKAPSCFSIVKREYGLKGRDKAKIVEAFTALLAQAERLVPVKNGEE